MRFAKFGEEDFLRNRYRSKFQNVKKIFFSNLQLEYSKTRAKCLQDGFRLFNKNQTVPFYFIYRKFYLILLILKYSHKVYYYLYCKIPPFERLIHIHCINGCRIYVDIMNTGEKLSFTLLTWNSCIG